jgi:hypothetical protein
MSESLTLVMLATGGTAALVGAAFLFGFNKSGFIADKDTAKQLFHRYASDIVPEHVVLSSDKASALMRSYNNRVFLVATLGDGSVTRELNSSNISPYEDGKVLIDLLDFGFPARYFQAEQSALRPMLDALKKGKSSDPA